MQAGVSLHGLILLANFISFHFLADRLKNIVIAYIWALLTNRQFSINMKHPCSLTEFLEPSEVFWNSTIECYDNLNMKGRLHLKQPFTSVFIEKISKLEYLTEFKSLNLIEFHSKVNLILLRANLDFIKPLSENKLLKEKLLSLGLVEKIENFKMVNIFRKVYNRLFKLSPKLDNKFETIKQLAKPNKNAKLFCAQLRIGGKNEFHNYTDRLFTERKNSKHFWNFIRNKMIGNETNYKIFITTDTESVAKEALKHFGKEKVIITAGDYVHIDVAFLYDKYKCESYEKTILDFHTFQLCDKTVVSRGGYGLMANYLRIDPFNEFYRYTEVFKNNNSKVKFVKFVKLNNIKDLEDNIDEENVWLNRIQELR